MNAGSLRKRKLRRRKVTRFVRCALSTKRIAAIMDMVASGFVRRSAYGVGDIGM